MPPNDRFSKPSALSRGAEISELWQVFKGAPKVLLSVSLLDRTEHDDHVVEHLLLQCDGDAIRGLLTRPKATGRHPGMLYAHAHGRRYDIGARELLDGRAALQGPPGPALARAGFVTLCIDMPAFGERAHPGEDSLVKAALWRGTTLMGQMLGELSAALDYLAGRDDVDASRIGALGISMGATHAYMLAALDPRIAAVAHLCCYADFETLVELNHHDLHGHYLTVPGFFESTSVGRIAGMIAPRPQLICNGSDDPLTPPLAIDRALAETQASYAGENAHKLACRVYPGVGHTETEDMRKDMLEFFASSLGSRPATGANTALDGA